MKSIDHLINELKAIRGSEFMEVLDEWIEDARNRYEGMPDDLIYLYRHLGYGNVGDSRYMIHALVDPKEIYDPETAKELDGCLIVGDDYAGNCEAYDAKNGWVFGTIADDGRFETYGSECNSFVKFLSEWFVQSENA